MNTSRKSCSGSTRLCRLVTRARNTVSKRCIEISVLFGFRPVKPQRITHEQFVWALCSGRDVGDEVDQQAVVRHVALQVGMGPVRAPQDAVGEGFDQRFRKGYDV